MPLHPYARLALLALLLAVTFAATLPFGRWRVRCRKYSLAWFLSIHLPIPLIFLMRTGAGFPWHTIPFFLLATVGGQIAGGRMRPRS